MPKEDKGELSAVTQLLTKIQFPSRLMREKYVNQMDSLYSGEEHEH